MSSNPRPTSNVVAIFTAMLERPRKAFYGLELARHAQVGSATIYAALGRMERAGLVKAEWEQVDPTEAGRPRRRLYRLTPEGTQAGMRMVAEHSRRRSSARAGRWLPGRDAEATP